MTQLFSQYANECIPNLYVQGGRRFRSPQIISKCSGQIELVDLTAQRLIWLYKIHFTFYLGKQLQLNLSVIRMSMGVTRTRCTLYGRMSLCVYPSVSCRTFGTSLGYIYKYCGQHSNFNLLPPSSKICLDFDLEQHATGHFHGLLQVFDSKVLTTYLEDRYSEFSFSSVFLVHPMKSFLYVGTIVVKKHSTILLKTKEGIPLHNTIVFDGPGFESERTELGSRFVFFTSSFQCFIILFGFLNSRSNKTGISFESQQQVRSKISLQENTTMTWPSKVPLAQLHFESDLFLFQVNKNQQIVLKVTHFALEGKHNKDCVFGGVAVFEENTNKMSFCSPAVSVFQARDTVYSNKDALVLVLYHHKVYCHVKTQIDVNITLCTAAELDVCSLRESCTGGGFSFSVCDKRLQDITSGSNISLKTKPTHKATCFDLMLSVPHGQCAVVQIATSYIKMPLCHFTLSAQPLDFTSGYIPSASLFYFYSVTGSFQWDKHLFSFASHSLKITGSLEMFTFHITNRTASLSGKLSRRTLKQNGPLPLLPKYADSSFDFKLISKQTNVVRERVLSFDSTIVPAVPGWIDFLLCNTSSDGVSEYFWDNSSHFSDILGPEGRLKYIPHIENMALQIMCNDTQYLVSRRIDIKVTSSLKDRFQIGHEDTTRETGIASLSTV